MQSNFSRKPPVPSFWRLAQWNEWFPSPEVLTSPPSLVPDNEVFSEAKLVIGALDPYAVSPPVSLRSAMSAAQSLDDWFKASGDILTWPPTTASFVSALQPLFLSDATPDARRTLGLLDALRPDLVGQAYQVFKLTDASSWVSSVIPHSEVSVEVPHKLEIEDSGKNTISAPKNLVIQWLEELLELPEKMRDHPSLVHEVMDGKVKAAIMSSKGVGARARNYWFEDNFLPLLCELSKEQMEHLLAAWPPHQQCSFNDPVKAMDGGHFWHNLRTTSPAARLFLMENLLPSIIKSEDWSEQQRLNMLEPLLSRVKDYPGLVRERLKFWEALGGDLTLRVPLETDESSLVAPTTSAQEWLDSHKISTVNSDPRPRKKPRGP